jgi:hypothetical protein
MTAWCGSLRFRIVFIVILSVLPALGLVLYRGLEQRQLAKTEDRRDRRLELDDIRTYCRIVTALKQTIDIQGEIDALYPEIEEQTLSLPGAPMP